MDRKSVDTRENASTVISHEQGLVLALPAKDFLTRKIAAIKESAIEGFNRRNPLEERLHRAEHARTLATDLLALLENFERLIPSLLSTFESLDRTRNRLATLLRSLPTSRDRMIPPVTPEPSLQVAQLLVASLKTTINDKLEPLPGIMSKISALRAPKLFNGLYEHEALRQMAALSDKYGKELPLQHLDVAWLDSPDTARGFAQLKQSLHDIITNNEDAFIKTRHSDAASSSAAKAQREYSESAESRALKLLSLVQAREHTSAQCSNDEKKIARLLGYVGCNEILRLLKNIGPEVLMSSEDQEAIQAVFQAILTDQTTTAQQPPQSNVLQPNQLETPVVPSSESDLTLPPSPEDLQFMRDCLAELGVKDASIIEETIEHLSLEGLTDLVACFDGIPLDVTQAILGLNPRLINYQSRGSLSRFTEDLRRILQDGRVNRSHYPIFDPLSNPECFSNPEVLKRTGAAYNLIVGAMIEADRLRKGTRTCE